MPNMVQHSSSPRLRTATQYMPSMSAARVGLTLVMSLAASMTRACKVGVCVTLSSGLTLSRYTCQSLKMWICLGCRLDMSVSASRKSNRRCSLFCFWYNSFQALFTTVSGTSSVEESLKPSSEFWNSYLLLVKLRDIVELTTPI